MKVKLVLWKCITFMLTLSHNVRPTKKPGRHFCVTNSLKVLAVTFKNPDNSVKFRPASNL